MNHRTSWATGAATLVPAISHLAIIVLMYDFWHTATSMSPTDDADPSGSFAVLLAIVIVSGLLTLGLAVFCILDVWSSSDVRTAHRHGWAAFLFTLPTVALPIYWWVRLRPRPGTTAAAAMG
jgi:hypothetical protein